MWVAGAFLALAGGLAACGSGGNTTGCTPGATQECACLGGTKGVQSCNTDGKGFAMCQCGSATSSGATSGSGGAPHTGASSSSGMPTCGDGKIEPSDHCDNPSSEFYCKSDCMMATTGTGGMGTGGACAGHINYAGKFDGADSVWAELPAAGGQTGLDAGNAQCKSLGVGADHVCDYTEVQAALAAHEATFMAIPKGTTAWVQRTTTVNLVGTMPVTSGGTPSLPGAGGRCNDWKYKTNHISNGEYAAFDAVGTPTFHLDHDTKFDAANPGLHNTANDQTCGGTTRSILCCFQSCP